MNFRKGFCALLLAAAAGLLLAACGGQDEIGDWPNEWGDLTLADFSVYQDGALAVPAEELETRGGYSFFDHRYTGRNVKRAELPTTLRGVAIEDSPEMVAGLYAGVECAVMDTADHEDEEEYSELYEDFATYLGGEALDAGTVGVTYALYFMDGEAMGLSDFRAYAAGGGSLNGVEGYSLTFLFQKGKVSGIYLDYARYGAMIEGTQTTE